MKLFTSSIIAAAAASLVQACTINIRVARDSTVAYNGIMCDNNIPCNSIPFGLKNDLLTFKGNRDYERVLLGFDLPTTKPISKCLLKIPTPIEVATTGEYTLTATVTDNKWNETAVTGANKDIGGTQIGSVNIVAGQKPGSIDVTSACKNAKDDKLSLFVDTSFPMVRFNSIQSGSPAIFSLDITY
ncbi:hypothetical protein FBU59_002526 [Linderina macrospora]|uniref:Uncharacterized protein n=1 Tax=Linderina macrospora TaxID=4868 RepID=A0ACC1JB75_9FUNG|nr:hypothetical protein FBU59_002526 [Linderina macrospora]